MSSENGVLIVSDDVIPLSSSTKKPFRKPSYNNSYQHFVEEGSRHCLRVYLTSHLDIDIDDPSKCYGWTCSNNEWRITEVVSPSVVVDKFRSIDEKSREKKLLIENESPLFINRTELSDLLQSKAATASRFKECFIPTFLAIPSLDLSQQIQSFIEGGNHSDLSHTRFVAKPDKGFGGRGVTAFTKSEMSHFQLGNNFVVQPFLETSHGIKGVVNRRHDLRVLIVNGNIVQSFVRIPLTADFVSNGGDIQYLDIESLPETVVRMSRCIDEQFGEFGFRFYSIDYGLGASGRPWVFEMNAKPGLVWNEFSKEDVANTKLLHRIFLQNIREIV